MNTRRDFLQRTATATGGLLASKKILLNQPLMAENAQVPAPSDRLKIGIIGIGMQGSGLLPNAISLPGIECVGAADLYDGRHTLAKEITGNPNLPTTRHYQELLDRKDIDCIVAAVPDHWHMRVVVDACNAGKDIYCEKPMSHTAEQGFAMVEAAKKNNRIVQIGSQRVSSVLCHKARELYQRGAIGDVEMVELTLGPQRSQPAPGSILRRSICPRKPGLGYLAQRRAENSLQQVPLRPLALLERVRHRRRRRSDGSLGQRNACYAWLERAAAVGSSAGRHLPLGKTAATCRTFTRCCSTITEFPSTSGSAWALRRRNWRASWGPKGILEATGTSLRYRRRVEWTPVQVITQTASPRRCTSSTSLSGTPSTPFRWARNPSPTTPTMKAPTGTM